MRNNIILCGFMGCGKTTVGKILADRLRYTFIDTDIFIEQRENMTVSEIFKEKGEPYFRNLETEVTENLGEQDGLVIATGGGMMLDPKNAQNLNKTGLSFWIKITPETVLKRLDGDTTRPLLQRDDKEQAVRELIAKREPLYAAACRFNIDGEADAATVAERIIKIINIDRPSFT